MILRSRFALAVVLALTFFARPSVVEAPKTGNVARVGFLYFGSREPGLGAARYAAFLEGLRELGYVEGKRPHSRGPLRGVRVVAGHVEPGESVTQAALREAREEVGGSLSSDRLRVVGVMHRRSREERVDFFLAYALENNAEAPRNLEPENCSELVWANLLHLPDDTIPYVRAVIDGFRSGVWFQEFGWEP